MNELIELLSNLVAINSINPDLVPGGSGEGQIAAYIADWMKRSKLEVHVVEVKPGRPNVLGIARGSGGGKTLLLNGHMDTVSVAGMDKPFEARIDGGRLYGRGAYDMKGGLAACLQATASARGHQLRGDVIVAAVMDEEYAGLGSIELARGYSADAAIVAESTEMRLILAHRGFVWLEIETKGVAAHGSRADQGVDAITKMGSVLVELEKLDQHLRTHPSHPLLGSGSLHASLIQGGQELSTYPERCVVSIERRTVPSETPEMVETELQELVERVHRRDPAFKAAVRRGLDGIPLETPQNAPIAHVTGEAITQVLGQAPVVAGVPYWTDAATLASAGIPSVLFGPSGAGAHATEEWVDLRSVQDCADVFLATALRFCS